MGTLRATDMSATTAIATATATATATETATARLREGAGRAADVLVENAISAGGCSTWFGVTVDWVGHEMSVVQRTGDAALYDGTAGIAMASWQVAIALGREDLADVALGAARHAVSARDRLGWIGLFDGLAGVGLAALEVGEGASDVRLRAAGLEVLGLVADTPPASVDLLSGSAGLVLALLGTARRTGEERWQAAAIRHGEHLLAAAKRNSWGWSWPTEEYENPALCGLSHGAAGVAWALGSLAAATGEERFLEAVAEARRYERSWFQPASSSWPDLRPETTPPGSPLLYPALWCHGATGIGLTRLALFALAEHPALAAEAASALQAATDAASQALHGNPEAGLTICHGLGGTVLLLLAAHRVLGEPEHLAAARWVAGRALDQLGEDPSMWPSGIPGGGFSPSLMTGLAGAMYALARAADPDKTGALPVLGDHGP